MGARRSSSRNTHTRANRRRAARSGHARPPLAWLRAAVLALGLSATAAGAAAARTSDLARMGVVSFYASRQLMLLYGPSTEPVGLPVARSYPHELDMSGDGGVLLIEQSLVERIDPADATQRWQLRLRLPDHGVLSSEGGRAYTSRAAPAVLTAIRVGAVGAPEWTLALPRPRVGSTARCVIGR